MLAFEPERRRPTTDPSYAARLRGRPTSRSPTDFVAHVRAAPDADESALLARALESVRAAEAAV